MKYPRVLLVSLVLLVRAHAQTGETLLRQVVNSVGPGKSGAVHDFGRLLKPGGISELEQVADELAKQKLRVRFVTVPPGTTEVGALTETAYRDAQLGANDLLIVFDGRRVYGKTLALEGERAAFDQAFKEAAPGFKLYAAKGMSAFAQAIQRRIADRGARAAATAEASRAQAAELAERRSAWLRFLVGVPTIVTFGLLGFVLYRRMRLSSDVREAYRAQIAQADLSYQRVALKLPKEASAEFRDEFLRLSKELTQLRELNPGRQRQAVALTEQFQALEARLPKSYERFAITVDTLDESMKRAEEA